MTLYLEHLATLATSAGAQVWHTRSDDPRCVVASDGRPCATAIGGGHERPYTTEEWQAIGKFIAAANPAAVLELVKEIKHLHRVEDQHRKRIIELETLINTPQTVDFFEAVRLEAAHQQERWGTQNDAGKAPEDWFWLLGYLAGKSLAAFRSGDRQKGLHHIISAAASLLNWHRFATGQLTAMRPGIDPEGRPL